MRFRFGIWTTLSPADCRISMMLCVSCAIPDFHHEDKQRFCFAERNESIEHAFRIHLLYRCINLSHTLSVGQTPVAATTRI